MTARQKYSIAFLLSISIGLGVLAGSWELGLGTLVIVFGIGCFLMASEKPKQ